MKFSTHILNTVVAAFLLTAPVSGPAFADEAELNKLFDSLAEPEQENWESIEKAIWREWSDSGSKAMNLLLNRGRRAMSDGKIEEAIDHFTALTDHAPDFAEGWNMRATAYFGAGHYGLSIADIQRTLALNPRHFGAMQGLGRMLEELDDSQNALTAYQAAYAIHPHRPGLKEAVERLEQQVSGQDL
ncbi:tetratricopeptide repeat protein [uncultured Litoreibacter sp.]|uniref:tetratricopeptide repeat protein n=1 Tax=uncultured Litoreibacter sp. TaxID=1392394 RepID=UPI0026085DC3|nr:tetratricopeptide repeat protein [uncultured Litoreibacter sp.]